jgi:hypothetical protein
MLARQPTDKPDLKEGKKNMWVELNDEQSCPIQSGGCASERKW